MCFVFRTLNSFHHNQHRYLPLDNKDSHQSPTERTIIPGFQARLRKAQIADERQRMLVTCAKEEISQLQFGLYSGKGRPADCVPLGRRMIRRGRTDEETKEIPPPSLLSYDESTSVSMADHLNSLLLQSSALRNMSKPERGLACAEAAVYLAELNELYTVASKAQLFRGMCLLDLGYPAEASWCFTRAASVCWSSRQVADWKEEAEKRRAALERGDPRREMAEDFKTVPERESLERLSLL